MNLSLVAEKKKRKENFHFPNRAVAFEILFLFPPLILEVVNKFAYIIQGQLHQFETWKSHHILLPSVRK